MSLPKELCPFLLIDMDPPDSPAPSQGKRCDYLFIGEYNDADWVAPMELKKGKAISTNIVPQLRAGAAVADRLVPNNANVCFRPMAAYGGGLTRYELNAFKHKKNKVLFRGQAELVRLIRCGASLTQGLGIPRKSRTMS